MPFRPPPHQESLVIVRPEERPWGFIVHAVAWVPIWGFVINAAVWLYFKNRSREMVFHIQQAMQFQIVALIPLIAWSLFAILANIAANLSPRVGGLLHDVNGFFLSAFLTLCAMVAIGGGASVYLGRPFLYPFFGQRVLEGSIRKMQEE